ncbi:MAG: DUF1905 domain-containing protein [Rhodothermales bacterium]|nr:DUF1905 domain-containing protein [Rhodothermales bacterium]
MPTFRTIVQGHDSGGAFVVVPFDVEATFGSKRPPVVAHLNGVAYRGTLVRMGGPEHLLLVRKDIQAQMGKGPGDEIEVTIEKDTAERTVTPPSDFAEALAHAPDAAAVFDRLAYTHRREYVQWIEDAKKPETRARRIEQAVTRLVAGQKAR